MPSKEGLTIGFLGTGEMEVDAATALIEEYVNEEVKGDEPVRFIFPLTTDEFSESLRELADMAQENKIAYEVITNTEDKNRRAHTEVANGASRSYHVVDVFTQMESILVEAQNAALMVLWDRQRDQELQTLLARFHDAGIKVMDLTEGLTVLGTDEPEEVAAPDEPDMTTDEYVDEDEDEDEAEAQTTEEVIYSRSDLENLSRDDVKTIAVSLGQPPRRAREDMITAILEAQGEPQTAPESPEEIAEAMEAALEAEGTSAGLEALEGVQEDFLQALEEMGNEFLLRMGNVLDDKITDLGKMIEGLAFNLSPEQPPVEEPPAEPAPAPRRRLLRP